jgi:hypothetical protein
MKPKLKAPGSRRWKRIYDGLVSNFNFNFNLRHYTKGSRAVDGGLWLAAGSLLATNIAAGGALAR